MANIRHNKAVMSETATSATARARSARLPVLKNRTDAHDLAVL